MNLARWKCCKGQTSEGVCRGRDFRGKKKGKVEKKNALDEKE